MTIRHHLYAALSVSFLVFGAVANIAFAQDIAITFDDLPGTFALPQGQTRLSVAKDIIVSLTEAEAPDSYGFINGSRLELSDTAAANAAILPMWRSAGFSLGTHTWSHASLSSEGEESFETEIAQTEPLLHHYMGDARDWHWVRFPFLDEGNTPQKRLDARKFLSKQGYHIASVTLSFADAAFNDPYARCIAKGDLAGVKDLEKRFLEAANESLTNETALAKSALGREVPLVLLLHFGAFDAHMLPSLLKDYKARGVHFKTLQDVMNDPIYKSDLDPSLPTVAPVSLESIAAEHGQAIPPNIWAPYAPYPGGQLDSVCR